MRLLPSSPAALRLTATASARLAVPCRAVFTKLFVLLLALGFVQAALGQSANFAGVQTTVPASGLDRPYGVAVDAAGDLFIVDGGNNRVLKVTPTGIQTTLPATGLSIPNYIAVDGSGDLYISDRGNARVVEVTPAGVQTTVPATGLTDPTGVAVDRAGDVFIADLTSGRVVEVTPAGQQTTVTASGLVGAYGVAVDGSGDVFIADNHENRVVEVTPGGVQSTVPATGLDGPLGVAVDGSGDVYILDSFHDRVVEVTPAGTQTTVPASGLGFANAGVAVDGDGDVFVADQDNNRVVEVQTHSVNFGSVNVCSAGQTSPAPCAQTETLNYDITADGTFGVPVALTQGAPGLDFSVTGSTCTGLLTAGTQCTVTVTFTPTYPGARNGAVELVDGSGNVLASTFVYGTGLGPQLAFSSGPQSVVATGINFPSGVALDGAGDLFIVDGASGQLVKQTPGGTQTTLLTGLQSPHGVAVDGVGDVFVADSFNNRVLELPAGGGGPISVGSGLHIPLGIAVDGGGNIFIADSGNQRLVEIVAATGAQTSVGSGFSSPAGVAVDSSGNIFVSDTDRNQNRVVEIPAGGGPQITLASDFNQPEDLRVDGAGNVFVADLLNGRIVEIPASGGPEITLLNNIYDVEDVAVDGSGNLFITDPGSQGIRELNRSEAPSFSFAATPVNSTSSDSPMSTQIQNTGNQPLSALPPGLAISGPFNQVSGSGDFTDCTSSFSLAPGALCNLSIDFTPQQLGQAQGSATFTDNSLNNTSPAARQTITLSGTGNPEQDTVTFTTPTQGASYAYGQSFQASATTSQGTAPIYSSGTPATASVTPTGQVTIVGVGGVTITAGQLPSGSYTGGSATVSFNAVQAATVTGLTGSINMTPANTATLVATVSPQNPGNYRAQPTGTVSFYDGGNLIGTAPLTAGKATLTTAAYTNSQTFTAMYTGDTNYAASGYSNAVPLTFTVAPTITFTTASSYAYGQSFQLMATSNSPGAFTYKLVSGPATVSSSGAVTVTGEGPVTVEADEAAGTGYNAGSKQATFTAVQATTTAMLTGSINTTPASTATLTATVAPQNQGAYPAQPTGMVSFYDAGKLIGTATLTGGKATLTTNAYSGAQSFTAMYNGDTNYTASAYSNAVPLTFTVAPTITFATAGSYAYGQSFQLMAKSNSAGAFTYKLVSGPATVSVSGAVTVTVTGEGAVTVEADEAAATGYNASSKQATFTAVQAGSSAKLTASAVKSGFGSAASLMVTVSPQYSGTPTGSVTFYDGSSKLATVALSGGTASYTTGKLVGAQHSYSATYSGDTNFSGSTSNTVPLTIAVTAVSLQLASTNLVYPLPPAFEVIVAATSGKPAPTGTVTVYDGTAAVATYTLYAQTKGYLIGLVLPPLNVGTHLLTAVYSGDANYAPGTSATTTVTVTPGPVQLSLSCQNTRLKLGQTLTCTVNADEGPLPVTGTVIYTVTGWGSGSVTLNKAGQATITYLAPQKGSFTLTATYAAQGNYQAAPSASVNFNVN